MHAVAVWLPLLLLCRDQLSQEVLVLAGPPHAYLSNIGIVFHDSVRACSECARRVDARAGLHSQVSSIPHGFVTSVFAATLERAIAQQLFTAQKLSE